MGRSLAVSEHTNDGGRSGKRGCGLPPCVSSISLEFQGALVRAIHEASPHGILAVNQDGIVISHNQPFLEMWGIQGADNLVGCADAPVLARVLHQVKDGEAFLRRVRELYEDASAVDHCEIELKDGRTFERHSQALRGERGQYWGRVWFFQDITARKTVEEALRRSEIRFRCLVESDLIGVFVGNREGEVTEANNEALSMLGYDRTDLEAHRLRWDRFTPPDQMPVVDRWSREIAAGRGTSPAEIEYLRKDGSRVRVLVGLASLRNPEGEAIGIALDLTARKRIEEDMRRARISAEVANQAKSQFLANMSHEIRTPMNGITGALDLVLGTALSSEQREYAGLAKLSADSLLGILNDILDLGKIEAGRLEMNPVEFSLRRCLEGVIRVFSVRAREKNLELTCEIGDDVPDELLGDDMRLRQVVGNLVGNALKFTERGGVRMVVARTSLPEEPLQLQFTIRDTGPGIPAGKQKLIFEPFRQADSTTTRRFGGTGLGLTICARLVEMMEGRIWVESTPPEGSTFHFTARFGMAEAVRPEMQIAIAANAPEVPSPPQPALKILLAEDNPVNQLVAMRLLERLGHRVKTARTGLEALQALKTDTPDVVLMDVQMPAMDGMDTTAAIRESEKGTGRHLPIIAMTASAMQGDREKCLAAGMDGYIPKPIRIEALSSCLKSLPLTCRR